MKYKVNSILWSFLFNRADELLLKQKIFLFIRENIFFSLAHFIRENVYLMVIPQKKVVSHFTR